MTQSTAAQRATGTAAAPAVSLRGVAKTFAGARALRGVDIDFRPGEIHALCGGNGSGKSTMIKVLCGVHRADEGGSLVVGDETIDADKMTPAQAHRLGIRVVHQDLAVFPELTVAENLAIDSRFETGFAGRIRWSKQHRLAEESIAAFEIPATPRTPLSKLPLAARTQVAIARALHGGGAGTTTRSGLLILDEPTAALPVHEVRSLLKALRQLAAQGQSILYVSHRLDEVLDIADRVSVLRDGRLVGTHLAGELDEPKLITLMLGRAVHPSPARTEHVASTGPVVLETRNLAVGAVQDVSLSVRRGEVVGIAGLMGSGRSSLLRAIFGDLRPRAGELVLDGRPVRFTHPGDAVEAGVIMVPENRVSDAAFMDQSVDTNMSVSVIGRYWRRGRIANRAIRQDTGGLIEAFGVKTSSGRVEIGRLSGGNQQKVIMARWLRREPRVMLLDEPTQGVDVGARDDIYKLIRRATRAGAVAIVVVSDLEELAQVVDRALVLRHGRIVAEVSGRDLTAHRLAELSYADGS
ncbi:sugar ABC transporter ATP-binding protein [Microbispora sp. H10836]|uniref:sugar ABC transporter ATP-binding protein n=1 Tax=Microbispora sp. H10836 TaxID=2729106 RepID=UPI001475D882|nr:sugar ABC transporter ATP-binding protein [Microbispora sp. H10836]